MLFGCKTYAHVSDGKLDPRAIKCIFVSYPKGVKGYKLWVDELEKQKCFVSREVTFNELKK